MSIGQKNLRIAVTPTHPLNQKFVVALRPGMNSRAGTLSVLADVFRDGMGFSLPVRSSRCTRQEIKGSSFFLMKNVNRPFRNPAGQAPGKSKPDAY